MRLDYYKYKTENLSCHKCKWEGTGEQAATGEQFSELFELDCPKCFERVAIISYPSTAEAIQHGTAEEKNMAERITKKQEEIRSSRIESESQLPDILGEIIIEAKEKSVDGAGWLEIYANEDLLWKELGYYEYYQRFIEICELLDVKYKGQIKAIKYDNSQYLLGDKISAPEIIKKVVDEIIN